MHFGLFIPKEKNFHTINQFRNISVLNMEDKIFSQPVEKDDHVALLKRIHRHKFLEGRDAMILRLY